MSNCQICGEQMPQGEEMFKFHGYSGPCPKPALRNKYEPWIDLGVSELDYWKQRYLEMSKRNGELEEAGSYAIVTFEHAITLGYLGEGSTCGMAKDAVQRLKEAGCSNPGEE